MKNALCELALCLLGVLLVAIAVGLFGCVAPATVRPTESRSFVVWLNPGQVVISHELLHALDTSWALKAFYRTNFREGQRWYYIRVERRAE